MSWKAESMSWRSIRGGPSAMSSALVPGRMRREAPLSMGLGWSLPWSSVREKPGDAGPVWSSAMGGGEGRRGDEAGEWGVAMLQSVGEEVEEVDRLKVNWLKTQSIESDGVEVEALEVSTMVHVHCASLSHATPTVYELHLQGPYARQRPLTSERE